MAKYQFPDLSGFEILYKGRRYIAFSINESHPFNDMEDVANFVVWDGYHNGAVSHGVINQDGTCTGELSFSHVNIVVKASKTIKEFVENTKISQERFFKDCGL